MIRQRTHPTRMTVVTGGDGNRLTREIYEGSRVNVILGDRRRIRCEQVRR